MRRRPRRHRPTTGARLLAGALAVALLAGTRALAEEPPLPQGTTAHAGLPPYRPRTRDGSLDLAAWCADCATQARGAPGTRRGGDLLFSAAHIQDSDLRDLRAAAALYAEAVEAYPAADVTRAVALLHWLRLESGRGNAPQAARLVARLARWTEREPPPDAEHDEARRWSTWQRLRREVLPPLLADHDEREGRPAAAAGRLEAWAATSGADLTDAERGRTLARAARLHYRAGAAAEAERTMRAAAQADVGESTRARMHLWSLYARHGLLDEQAAPRVDDRWPGAAFERDLEACLRALDGLRGAGTTYLALASRAYAARRLETALSIYQRAVRDPDLAAAARGDPTLWRGLLLGYAAALELGRLDDAERMLEAVERMAEEAIPEKQDYQLAVRRARARLEAARPDAARPQPVAPTVPDAAPRPAPHIATGEAEGEARDAGQTRPAGSPPAGSPAAAPTSDAAAPWATGILAVLAVLLAAGVHAALRRRGRRRGS